MDTILITGVSSGIGFGIAQALLKNDNRVIGTVRKESDAERLLSVFGERFQPLILDVTDSAAIQSLPSKVHELCGPGGLQGLINNAGMAKSAPVELQSMEDFREQFEVNFFGLVAVTKALLPLLGTDRTICPHPGRILNISSVGGLLASPFLAAYAASKHAVEGFSHSLRRELRIFGIKVVIIGPGSVKSQIWSKAADPGNPFSGTPYGVAMDAFRDYAREVEASGFSPEEFGDLIVRIYKAPRPRPRYAVVRGKLVNWTVPRLLPHGLLDLILSTRLRLSQN